MRFFLLAFLLVLSTILTACAPAPEGVHIEVEDAWVRAAPAMPMTASDTSGGTPMGGNNSAAYMVIRNTGKESDTLLSVQADVSEVVELHTSQTKNGVTMMSAVENMVVPDRGKIELKPGGLHIMLIKIKQDLVAGEKVILTLVFEKSGEVQVEAEIREP